MINFDMRGAQFWQFPREFTFTPRPQGRLSTPDLVAALITDETRATLKRDGVTCLCPECLGLKTDDNGLSCTSCLGTGSVVALPVQNNVEELPL